MQSGHFLIHVAYVYCITWQLLLSIATGMEHSASHSIAAVNSDVCVIPCHMLAKTALTGSYDYLNYNYYAHHKHADILCV